MRNKEQAHSVKESNLQYTGGERLDIDKKKHKCLFPYFDQVTQTQTFLYLLF